MGKQRVFVIGLDAADPDLLEAWIRSGELPFFKQLMQEGTYCRLACIPPTFSPVEWTSILTGTNPGKHGVFGFEKPVDGGRGIKVLNRTDRRTVAFYEILAEAGQRVGLINMVMTYPAAPINGFMITGMETPDLSSPGISYPEGLIEELRSAGCDYRISSGVSGLIMDGKMREAIAALEETTDERYKAATYLMEKFDPDWMVVLFSQIDNCGHYFWRLHDELHSGYSEEDRARFGDVMLRVYQQHERTLQDLMGQHLDATFLICSDHGMGFNYEARYYMRALFTRLGWFCPTTDASAAFGLQDLLARAAKGTYWFLFKRLPMRHKRKLATLFPALRSRVENIVSGVDWDRSRVYSNDEFFSVVINKVDADGNAVFASKAAYLDFREGVIAKLQALEELDTGLPLVKQVHTREVLYTGDCVEDAPDLVIEWEEVRLRHGIRCGEITIRPEEIEKSELQDILSGEHRPYGILLMKGEMIERGRRMADGSILDIAPTALYLAGQPIPQTIDGKVLVEAFCEPFKTQNPVKYTDGVQIARDEEEFSFSMEESIKVQERLRRLGYIE